MRLSYKFSELSHQFFVRRVIKAYDKKIEKRFKNRPDLKKSVDSETTKRHIELYGKLGLPSSDKWLRLFTNMSGIADYRYVPEDLFFARIERVLNNCERSNSELEDKNLLSKFVDKEYLPKIHLRYIRGLFYDEDYNFLTEDQAQQILQTDNGDIIGKKAVDSSGGHGVQPFYFNNGHYSSAKCDNLTISWIKEQGESYVIQEIQRQCAFSAQFNPTSVNTYRLTSLRLPWSGEVIITKSAMRIGVSANIVDNASSGGISIGLSREGELGEYAYEYYTLKSHKCHPVTKVVFKGQIHPYYRLMCDTIISQAKKIPNFNLISWDVITDENGRVKILEANATGQGHDIHQFAFGSLFGEHTEQLIDWIAQHVKFDTFKHFRTF